MVTQLFYSHKNHTLESTVTLRIITLVNIQRNYCLSFLRILNLASLDVVFGSLRNNHVIILNHCLHRLNHITDNF